MDNQITLTALQTLLETKKAQQKEHIDNVYTPAIKAKTTEIFSWLRENVSNLIPKIDASSNRIEIMKSESPHTWASCTIYLERTWNAEESYCKMNWYGSNAGSSDQSLLNDVQIFGAIAANLSKIEHQFINNWKQAFKVIESGSENLDMEIHNIERNIQKLQYEIRNNKLNEYKKVGFSLGLDAYVDTYRDWENENEGYKLIEKDASIRLLTGRSKWDYVHVSGYKVIKANKYKATLEVVRSRHDVERPAQISTYEISTAKFDQFIHDVYEWQNGGSERYSQAAKRRLESYANLAEK